MMILGVARLRRRGRATLPRCCMAMAGCMAQLRGRRLQRPGGRSIELLLCMMMTYWC